MVFMTPSPGCAAHADRRPAAVTAAQRPVERRRRALVCSSTRVRIGAGSARPERQDLAAAPTMDPIESTVPQVVRSPGQGPV